MFGPWLKGMVLSTANQIKSWISNPVPGRLIDYNLNYWQYSWGLVLSNK